MSYDDRNYLIISGSEVLSIDFDQVMETSTETLRWSVDGQWTFVKWTGVTMPACCEMMTSVDGPYTYDEILSIMSGSAWTPPSNTY